MILMSDYKYYRGFIPTNGKKASIPFKGKSTEELPTESEVASHKEYAGVLESDVILLDFDNAEDAKIAEKIIASKGCKCRLIKTDRGIHALFRRDSVDHCSTGVLLACGLRCDIKVGCSNSYEMLKMKGVNRGITSDCDYPDLLPPYFKPIPKALDKSEIRKGNRNTTLFAYCITLMHGGLSQFDAKLTIGIINEFILKEPLSVAELDVITRDESFLNVQPNFYSADNKFLHDKFAHYLVDTQHVIKISGVLHIYEDGIYINQKGDIESRMIQILPSLTQSKRDEIYNYLNIIIRHNTPEADPRYIAFKDGIYDLSTKQVIPLTPNIILTNIIPHCLPKNTEANLVDTTLMKLACGNENIFKLLCEVAGYCLFRRNELGKAFFFIGNHNNGKSTYIDMLRTMLGSDNVSAMDVADFTKGFYCAGLLNKLANLGDDIADSFIFNTSILKKLITGDSVRVDNKYELPFDLTNYAKMLFSANEMPGMSEKTGDIQRRIIPIPFKGRFTDKDPDFRPFIKYDLQQQECVARFIALALEGLGRVLSTNMFTIDEAVKLQLTKLSKKNNPMLQFVEDYKLDKIINHSIAETYSRYKYWCLDYGIEHPLGRISFVNSICAMFGLKEGIKQERGLDKKLEDIKVLVKDAN